MTVNATAPDWFDILIGPVGLPQIFGSPIGPRLVNAAQNLFKIIKNGVCKALPQGRVESVNGSVGGVGGQNASLSVVINYSSGQVSGFATGGFQAGWNGLIQGSVSTGFIYGSLGSNNSGYSGLFVGGSGSGATFGGFGSFSSNVDVFGASFGGSISPFTFGGTTTLTSNPLNFGAMGEMFKTPPDNLLTSVRQSVCQ